MGGNKEKSYEPAYKKRNMNKSKSGNFCYRNGRVIDKREARGEKMIDNNYGSRYQVNIRNSLGIIGERLLYPIEIRCRNTVFIFT